MAYTRITWENAPSNKTPINANNLNRMEDGIEEALGKGTKSYLSMVSDNENNSYYYEIYKYTVGNTQALSLIHNLTEPYYYYELEGWAKCTSVSDDGNIAYFNLPFTGVLTDITDGSKLFFNNGGDWFSIPQTLCLGHIETKTISEQQYDAFRVDGSYSTSLIKLNAEIQSVTQEIDFFLNAEYVPTTSSNYKFSESDVASLAMYFKIKLDQKRTNFQS